MKQLHQKPKLKVNCLTYSPRFTQPTPLDHVCRSRPSSESHRRCACQCVCVSPVVSRSFLLLSSVWGERFIFKAGHGSTLSPVSHAEAGAAAAAARCGSPPASRRRHRPVRERDTGTGARLVPAARGAGPLRRRGASTRGWSRGASPQPPPWRGLQSGPVGVELRADPVHHRHLAPGRERGQDP